MTSNFENSSAYAIIIPICFIGMIYAIYNAYIVSKVDPSNEEQNPMSDLEFGMNKNLKMVEIGGYIQEGANAFLFQEYKFLAIYLALFAIVVFFMVDFVAPGGAQAYTTISFLVGSITSIVSGYIGMKIATYANYRTAFKAISSLADGFVVAFRAGCVMGFSLVSLALLNLTLLLCVYKKLYNSQDRVEEHYTEIMECIAGYGLGGSTVALFGRVGGGIYTKAADVGADLVGKVEHDLPEDSPKNPATIADNVGDNVGDIAGMGADLFGSFAEATCAALVVSSVSPQLVDNAGSFLFYPLIISAFGIIVCLITSFFATNFMKVNENHQIERTLKFQLIISTVILTPVLYLAAWCSLPKNFDMVKPGFGGGILPDITGRNPTYAFGCSILGLWGGLIIGGYTEYMTSHQYKPVREVAGACHTGAATNIIYGLALGYLSNSIPVIVLAIISYASLKMLGMFGVSLAAIGMLSNLSTGLAIDAYGPISDNAGGIAEMSELGEEVRERTDALDAAGNTTAAIGKGFAIGSAALVSLSLYGAFITRASKPMDIKHHRIIQANVTEPFIFAGLLIGALLPYIFSAMTMKAVGIAALDMVVEIRRQLRENPLIKTGEQDPDYKSCIKISTNASLKKMVAPGCLVILTPIIVGIIFGPKAVAGLLPGALVSGVQLAISASNSGGAWDNAKKYIEGGNLIIDDEIKKKGSEEHKAAVIGDTVGDPLKDTSGPSLNILVKLMAILSLVFGDFFCKTGFLVCPFGEGSRPGECQQIIE